MGPFSLEEARRHGLTRYHLRAATWQSLGGGFYAVREIAEQPLVRLAAVARRLPSGAVFSGRTAAWLHGLDLAPCNPIEVTVPIARRSEIERSIAQRLPVTSRVRTLADLGRCLPLVEAVAALDAALHKRLLKMSDLVENGASFGDALKQLGLTPAFDELVLFARWVTPALLRRRFDARFYLARLPSGQTITPQEGEVSDWLWISPAGALSNADITLVYATRAVLESVAGATDVSALFARARALGEIPIVEPRIVQTENGWEIVRD